jgi:putative membrane protein
MNDQRLTWRARPANAQLSKKLSILAWILSTAVLLLVVVMQKVKLPLPAGWSTACLPPIHAGINALAAVTLIVALIFIKLGKVAQHRAAMMMAMGLSIVFLLSYVAYHMTNDPTRYGGSGPLKLTYFALLASHILLAAISLPFILFTFIAAWTNHFAKHRRLARWVFPIWLYVTLTGPICYWMLRPYY